MACRRLCALFYQAHVTLLGLALNLVETRTSVSAEFTVFCHPSAVKLASLHWFLFQLLPRPVLPASAPQPGQYERLQDADT